MISMSQGQRKMISNLSKFDATVLSHGEQTKDIFAKQCLITFKHPVPLDLQAFCVTLKETKLNEEVMQGDHLYLNDEMYEITSVGAHVMHSLETYGHASIYFDAREEALLPGCIHVRGVLDKDIILETIAIK